MSYRTRSEEAFVMNYPSEPKPVFLPLSPEIKAALGLPKEVVAMLPFPIMISRGCPLNAKGEEIVRVEVHAEEGGWVEVEFTREAWALTLAERTAVEEAAAIAGADVEVMS